MNFLPMLRVASPLTGLLLASCALSKPPVAESVEKAPAGVTEKKEVAEVPVESVPVPVVPNEGLRLPGGLLELPNEAELRTPVAPKGGAGGGTLVVRPPAEPVPRPPKDPAAVDAPGEN
jgi:hypothetical protein